MEFTKKDNYELFTALRHAAKALYTYNNCSRNHYKKNILITKDSVTGTDCSRMHHYKIENGIEPGYYSVSKLTKTKIIIERNCDTNSMSHDYNAVEAFLNIDKCTKLELKKNLIYEGYSDIARASNATYSFHQFEEALEFVNNFTVYVNDNGMSSVCIKSGKLSAIISHIPRSYPR